MKQEQTDAMERAWQALMDRVKANNFVDSKDRPGNYEKIYFGHGYAAALEAGKAVDEKPEPDAMSTEDHINEIRSARKLTLADYGLVIHND
jgi:hypothetical protein